MILLKLIYLKATVSRGYSKQGEVLLMSLKGYQATDVFSKKIERDWIRIAVLVVVTNYTQKYYS
jgi:hypothetical protein